MGRAIQGYVEISICVICLTLLITSVAAAEGETHKTASPITRSLAVFDIPEEARELFEKGFELNKGKPDCPLEILRQKEYFYIQAIEIHENYPLAWSNLGDVYENMGELKKAIEAYDRAIALLPTLAVAYFSKGDVLFRCRRYEEAIQAYEEGLTNSPDKENELLTQRRIKAIKDIISGTEKEKGGIIPSSVFVEVLDQEVTRGVDGVGSLPTVSLGESVLPFAFNSGKLDPQAKRQLDELAKALKSPRLAKAHLRLEGHTDERGTAEYNLELSMRRSQSVKDYLVNKHNIDRGRLHVRPYGKSIPIIPGAKTDAEHAVNRRVEVRRIDGVPEPPANPGSKKLSLHFGVLHAKETGQYAVIRDGQATLRSGDYYQVYLRPNTRCYVYLTQENSGSPGRVDWLFPSRLVVALKNPLEAGEYWLPARDRGFRLDSNPGDETIRLLASLVPAADLKYLAERRLRGKKTGKEVRGRIKVRDPGRTKTGPPMGGTGNDSLTIVEQPPGLEPIAFRTEVTFFHR